MPRSHRLNPSTRRGRQPFVLAAVEHYPVTPRSSLIRVRGFLGDSDGKPAPALLVTSPEQTMRVDPLPVPVAANGGETGHAQRGSRWAAAYEVPARLAGDEDAAFALALADRRLIALPVPLRTAELERGGPLARDHGRLSGRRVWAALSVLIAAVVAGWALLAGPGSTPLPSATARPAPSWAAVSGQLALPPGFRAPAAVPVSPLPPHAPGTTIVARAVPRRLAIYGSPTARAPARFLRNRAARHRPLVLMVLGAAGNRIHVAMPVRPNGSSGWVRDSQVSLLVDPYRLRIDLVRRQLSVYRRGRWLEKFRVGVGRAVTPTPAGVYYITELLRQPNPRGVYGPYAFGLSAHSNVLHEFATGNGQIGIHGTNQPAAIGRFVSHGCIRLTNRDIVRLARMLPLGTPVAIVHRGGAQRGSGAHAAKRGHRARGRAGAARRRGRGSAQRARPRRVRQDARQRHR